MSATSSNAMGVSGYTNDSMMIVFLSSAVSRIIETDIANVLRSRCHIKHFLEMAVVLTKNTITEQVVQYVARNVLSLPKMMRQFRFLCLSF